MAKNLVVHRAARGAARPARDRPRVRGAAPRRAARRLRRPLRHCEVLPRVRRGRDAPSSSARGPRHCWPRSIGSSTTSGSRSPPRIGDPAHPDLALRLATARFQLRALAAGSRGGGLAFVAALTRSGERSGRLRTRRRARGQRPQLQRSCGETLDRRAEPSSRRDAADRELIERLAHRYAGDRAERRGEPERRTGDVRAVGCMRSDEAYNELREKRRCSPPSAARSRRGWRRCGPWPSTRRRSAESARHRETRCSRPSEANGNEPAIAVGAEQPELHGPVPRGDRDRRTAHRPRGWAAAETLEESAQPGTYALGNVGTRPGMFGVRPRRRAASVRPPAAARRSPPLTTSSSTSR